MAAYNEESFRRKMEQFTQSQKIRNKMYAKATANFEDAKQDMLEEYEDSDVIRELREGPELQSSKFISRGNLFAFFGFDKGDDPATELKEYLKASIKMNKTPVVTVGRTKVTYAYKINIPSERQIYSNSSGLEWTNKSWVDFIENGLGNAGMFIFSSLGFGDKSRSGTGLQLKKGEPKDPPSFTPMKFLSEILENFIERFKK